MSRRLVPATLGVLVVLSGCMGAFAGGNGSPTTSPGERLDPATADLPPGVEESGVANATALVAAHDRTLRDEGFVLNGTLVRDPPGPRNQTRQYHTAVAPGADRFRTDLRTTLTTTRNGSRAVVQRQRTSLWGNGTATVRRVALDGSTFRDTVEAVPTTLALTRAPQYASYLDIGAFAVERVVARDGHTYTTLVATDTSSGVDEDVTIDARFVVDERGVVHEAAVTLTGPDGGTDRADYRVVRFGATPERPDWLTSGQQD